MLLSRTSPPSRAPSSSSPRRSTALMVGLREPLAYRHHREWGEMLTRPRVQGAHGARARRAAVPARRHRRDEAVRRTVGGAVAVGARSDLNPERQRGGRACLHDPRDRRGGVGLEAPKPPRPDWKVGSTPSLTLGVPGGWLDPDPDPDPDRDPDRDLRAARASPSNRSFHTIADRLDEDLPAHLRLPGACGRRRRSAPP